MRNLITAMIKKKILLALLTSLSSGVFINRWYCCDSCFSSHNIYWWRKSDGGSAGCGTVGGDLTMAQMKANFEPNAKGGILEGKSQYLLDLAKKNKIPQSLFVAILAQESGWGKSQNAIQHNNVASLMGNSNELWGYKTVEDNLEHYAKILKMNILIKV